MGRPGYTPRGGRGRGGGGSGDSGCHKCGQNGHFARECPNSGGGGGGGGGGRGCFKCGEEGHMSRECPNNTGGGGGYRGGRSDGGGGNRGCFKCGEEGHMSRECPNNTGGGGRSGGGGGNRGCFKCGEEGHMSRECPSNADGGGYRGGRGGRDSRGGRGGFRGGRGGGAGGFKSPRGGRGGFAGRGKSPRGGRGGGGFRGGKKVIIEPHERLMGVFIARGKEDALVTKNMVPGESVYGEKRISIDEENGKIEYRVWNPFRSKLGAAILGGIENTFIIPGSKVLYLGAASGTTVSHVSDIVGPDGRVYAVEFSHRSGRDLLGVAQKRPNIVPIIEDARHPHKYRMVMSMVDTIFADVAQPDQARIVTLNAQHFLKIGGHIVISIKANCIDSTAPAEAVFAQEVKKLQQEKVKPLEQVTLEPYERDHAVVVGVFRSEALNGE